MSRRVPVAVAVAALALPFLPGTAASAPAESVQEQGLVMRVADGDTIAVDVFGDGTSDTRSVRFSNVQAMETKHVNQPGTRDHCHAQQAKARLTHMVDGKEVQLRAMDASSGNSRLLRSVWVQQYGEWTDVQRTLLAEGHVLWSPRRAEWIHNKEYSQVAQEAALRGVGLWDTDFCGAGPQQDAQVRLYVNWDADGPDKRHPNGEYVVVKNTGDHALPLGGWRLRGSSHDTFAFPSWATVPAGGSVKVRVGKGENTNRVFHWGGSGPMFDNVDGRGGGDGAYLLDPDEDLRFWFMYPCHVQCQDPLTNQVAIRKVRADAPRGDGKNPNGEFIKLRSRATHRIGLEGYVVRSEPYSYAFPRGTFLKPGDTLTLKVGKGERSRLRHFWGKRRGILNNSGDAVSLESFAAVRIDCKSWRRGSC